MDFINQLIPENILYALGWTVVHSLWQSFIVALLLSAYLLALQKTNARMRYIAGNVALAAILAAAITTFFIMLKKTAIAPELASSVIAFDGLVTVNIFEEAQAVGFSEYFNENMPLIVTVWLVGMFFFLLKMLGGLLYLQRLRHRYLTPLPRQWQEMLGALAGELNLQRHVQLAESVLVRVPLVIGWLKPVILMPIGAVNSLTTEQVEAILAHELAHIARHDFLVNLLQSVIEILFYFNPAVWWISANVRTERENCCDDLAVQLCGDSLAYAKSLVSLQEMHQAAPAFAMPFSKNKNQLLNRIQRILQPSQNKSNVMEKLSATLLLLAAVVMLSVQANTPFGNLLEQAVSPESPDEFAFAPEDDGFIYTTYDTIPGKSGETWIQRTTDEEEIELRKKNGEIIYLKVNGEEIPPERYAEFQDLIDEMDMPPPPPPPAPPAPPAPRFREVPPVPPAAPAPPTPPAPETRTRRIITQKSGNGTTFIIESEDGNDPVEIHVKDGKKGKITINGTELKGLKKGEKTIIVEEIAGDPNTMFWNGDYERSFVLPELAPLGELHFAPEEFAFEMIEPSLRLKGFISPEVNEVWREKQQLMQEMQDRMRDGNLSKEWMKEFEDQMREHELAAPQVLELQELRERSDENRARLQERQEEMKQRQLEQMDRLQLRQEEIRNRQEARQLELERMERSKQKSRTGKRLIKLQEDGSM